VSVKWFPFVGFRCPVSLGWSSFSVFLGSLMFQGLPSLYGILKVRLLVLAAFGPVFFFFFSKPPSPHDSSAIKGGVFLPGRFFLVPVKFFSPPASAFFFSFGTFFYLFLFQSLVLVQASLQAPPRRSPRVLTPPSTSTPSPE